MGQFRVGMRVKLVRHHSVRGDYGIDRSCFGRFYWIGGLYDDEKGRWELYEDRNMNKIKWVAYEEMLDPAEGDRMFTLYLSNGEKLESWFNDPVLQDPNLVLEIFKQDKYWSQVTGIKPVQTDERTFEVGSMRATLLENTLVP